MFYARLFEFDPGLRPLFKGDIREQGAALLWALQQGLGDVFTDETGTAWAASFAVLDNVMKSAPA